MEDVTITEPVRRLMVKVQEQQDPDLKASRSSLISWFSIGQANSSHTALSLQL